MVTKYVDWNEKQVAVEALRRGEVVLFPTETVYGIACIGSSKEAYDALREAKGRPAEKPFTLMCADIASAVLRGKVNAGATRVMQQCMPGELTVLLPSRPGTPYPMDLGTGVLGVRIPNAPEVLALIEAVGEPLLVSSANMSGGKPALDFETAKEIFDGRVSVIVRGACVSQTPSTIVDLTSDAPKLIRQGSLDFKKIEGIYHETGKPIAIGCDHGGYDYKEAIKAHLAACGYDVIDVGCFSKASVDYPLFARDAAKKVASGEAGLGVLVCTSGEGISMAANKIEGIRCGIGYDDMATAKTREHNNANMIAFGQKYMKLEDVLRRVDLFLSTPFSIEEKHHRRVDEIGTLR